jgi:hypothetical protein
MSVSEILPVKVEAKVFEDRDWETWKRLEDVETQYQIILDLYKTMRKGVLEGKFEAYVKNEIYRYLPEEAIEKAVDKSGQLKIDYLWNKLKSSVRAELINQFLMERGLINTIALNKNEREYYVLYGYNNIILDLNTWGLDILTLLFGKFMSASSQKDVARIMKATAKPISEERLNPANYIRLKSAILDLETLNLVRLEEVGDYYFNYVMPVFTSKTNLDHLRLAIREIAEDRYDVRTNKVYQLFRPRFEDRDWEFLVSGLGVILSPRRAKLLMNLIGEPNSGKSTFLRIIRKPIEPIVASVSLSDVQQDRFGKEPLLGKQVLITSESQDVYITKVGVLNQIFGESDVIEVNRKNQKYAKLHSLKLGIVSMNDPPIIKDSVTGAIDALIERLSIVTMFRPEGSENIPGLADMVSPEEAFNFLLWCRRQLELSNWQVKKLSKEEILNIIRENSNTAYQFLNMATDLLDFDTSRGCKIRAKELHEIYVKWCETHGIKPMGRNIFYEKLRAKGYEFFDYEGVKWIRGICKKGEPREQALV